MRRTIKKWVYDIIFVDSTRDIQDPMLLGFSQNLTEFWYYRFRDSANINKVVVVNHHDVAMHLVADSDSDFVVIAEIGNTFHNVNSMGFLDALDLELDADTFLTGHILDRGDRYYEVHSQCYVVNVRGYKRLSERPVYTPRSGVKVAITRSDENFHDDYTPTWIAPGGGTSYVHWPAPGADLIATGLKIRTFSQSVRDSKLYIYPKKPPHRGLLSGLLRRSGPNRHRHYAFSYEPMPDGIESVGKLDFIACPCNGLNLFRYLRTTGFNDGLRIQLYDINPMSTAIYQRIMGDWNGLDYKGLFNGLAPVVRTIRLDEYWQDFVAQFGGPAEWLRFLNRVRSQNVSIDVVDLLDIAGNLSWDATGNSLFIASNIYDFSETGLYYNTEYRVLAYQKLLDSLPASSWVHTIFPLRTKREISRVGDETMEPIADFPWRR